MSEPVEVNQAISDTAVPDIPTGPDAFYSPMEVPYYLLPPTHRKGRKNIRLDQWVKIQMVAWARHNSANFHRDIWHRSLLHAQPTERNHATGQKEDARTGRRYAHPTRRTPAA